jgi:hypothetical protein
LVSLAPDKPAVSPGVGHIAEHLFDRIPQALRFANLPGEVNHLVVPHAAGVAGRRPNQAEGETLDRRHQVAQASTNSTTPIRAHTLGRFI